MTKVYIVGHPTLELCFVTNDKQLAYETRKEATSNLYFPDGIYSKEASLFCEMADGLELLYTEGYLDDVPESGNYSAIVPVSTTIFNKKEEPIVDVNVDKKLDPSVIVSLIENPIVKSISVTDSRQSGLTTNMVRLATLLSLDPKYFVYYVTHEKLIDAAVDISNNFFREANKGSDIPAKHLLSFIPPSLADCIIDIQDKALLREDGFKLVVFADNVHFNKSVLNLFDLHVKIVNVDKTIE